MADHTESFDPYQDWLGIPPDEQPPTHYRLLDLDELESDAEVIDAAAKRRAAFLHQIASGPHRKQVQQLLNEVATARRTLLNTEAKRTYDQTLAGDQGTDRATAAPAPLIQVSDDSGVNADPTNRRTSGRPRKKTWRDDWRILAVAAAGFLLVGGVAVAISIGGNDDSQASDAGAANAMELAANANASGQGRFGTSRSFTDTDSLASAPSEYRSLVKPENDSARRTPVSKADSSKQDLQSLTARAEPAPKVLATEDPVAGGGRVLAMPDSADAHDKSEVFKELGFDPDPAKTRKPKEGGPKTARLNLPNQDWMEGMEPVETFDDPLADRFKIRGGDDEVFSMEDGKLLIGVAQGEAKTVVLKSNGVTLRSHESIAIETNIRKKLSGARVGLELGELRLFLACNGNNLELRARQKKLAGFRAPNSGVVTLSVIMDSVRPGSFNWIVQWEDKNVSGCAKLESLAELDEIPVGLILSCPRKEFKGNLWIDNLRKGVLVNPPDLQTPMEIPLHEPPS